MKIKVTVSRNNLSGGGIDLELTIGAFQSSLGDGELPVNVEVFRDTVSKMVTNILEGISR